jgi:hypothetical protein
MFRKNIKKSRSRKYYSKLSKSADESATKTHENVGSEQAVVFLIQ